MLSRPTAGTIAMKMRLQPTPDPVEQQVHPGHDWFFVLDGRVRLSLGEREVVVEAGEAAEFATMTPHALTAVDGPAELIMLFDRDGHRAHAHQTGVTATRPTIAAMANPHVDEYVARSEKWPEVVAELRPILLGAGLTEEVKWAKPCYTHEGKNIVIVQEMKDFCALMFFKGALLSDPKGVLEEQGPNSRSARRIRFTSVDDVAGLADTVHDYLTEAIRVEQEDVAIDAAPDPVAVPELQDRLDRDPSFKAAFEALTPGRQREYHLYFSAAKQATTRAARVERCAGRILEGRGLRDR